MTDISVPPIEPAPTAVPEPELAPAATESPTKPRRLGLKIAGIVVGALVVIGGALGITYAVIAAQHTPEKQLEAFLQHLVDGEAEAALDELTGPPPGSAALLTDEIYAGATDRVSAFEITGSDIDGPDARVTASITQGDETYDFEFALVRVDFDFVWDVWRVAASTVPGYEVSLVRPDGVDLTANGEAAPFVDQFESLVPALPGSYEFAASGTTDFITVEPVTELVTFADEEPVNASLAVILTEQGVASATAAVNGFLDGCLSQPVMAPAGCGYSITEDGTSYSNQRWSTPGRPGYTIGDWRDDGLTTPGWFVQATGPMSLDWNADFTNGTATGGVTGYIVRGYITSIGEDGAAVFESYYQ